MKTACVMEKCERLTENREPRSGSTLTDVVMMLATLAILVFLWLR